jgi:hypothetical protein
MALAVLAVVAAIATTAGNAAHRRIAEVGAREARVQGRELALGAQGLADGATVTVGAWQVTRRGDLCTASGPRGTYRLTLATGIAQESWHAAH